MVDTSAEAVAKTWEEYCNSARSRGTHEDGETEEYGIDDMNDAAHELHLLNEVIAAERDALRAQLDDLKKGLFATLTEIYARDGYFDANAKKHHDILASIAKMKGEDT